MGRLIGMLSFWACLCTGMQAQNRVHLGLGINQSYAQLDSLNYVLNAFNAENSWTAEKPLHEIHMPAGITGHIGGDFKGVLVDFHYTMRVAASRARGSLGSGSFESQVAQVRYNASSFDLGLGLFVVRKARFRAAFGQSLDFGSLRVSARRGVTPSVTTQPYGRYVNELNFGTTTFLHLMIAFGDGVSPGIFIRPYYQFSLRQNDYQPLNRVLRPQTSLQDTPFILGKQSNFGLKVGIYLGS
jgi:hypothetical protein